MTSANRDLPRIIRTALETAVNGHRAKEFHYYSRMYNWTGRSEYRSRLGEVQNSIIGANKKQTQQILAKLINNKSRPGTGLRSLRLTQYPELCPIKAVLHRAFAAKFFFGVSIHPQLLQTVPRDKLRQLRDKLLHDPVAIAELSSLAVNTLYYMDHLLGGEFKVNPKCIIEAALAAPAPSGRKAKSERVYLFTHAVIGASAYYAKPIKKNLRTYRQIIKLAEQLIADSYDEIRLDAKIEYLVANRLLGRASPLEQRIISQAESWLSPDGNYIIDPGAPLSKRYNILRAEHRNVLYCMTQETWQHAGQAKHRAK